jgi:hypothetical protein
MSARVVLAGAAAGSALLLLAPPATAHGRHGGAPHDGGPPVEVVASGLSDPWSVRFDGRGRLVVAEQGTGEVTRVEGPGAGGQRVLAIQPGLAAADTSGRTVLALTSGPEAPDATVAGQATLFAGHPGQLRPLADLLAHERATNPDGQVQDFPDALSNPFSVLTGRGKHAPLAYVADGGANDVLAVGGDGKVSTFFVPPTVSTGACAGAENNTGTTGCDSVPTGLAHGPDGKVYVAALTAGAPGEGRVYVVDRRGRLVREISGFTGPTGVAVADDGTVYVSELTEGAPPEDGPLPAGFDPSTIGRIVAVAPDGRRSAAQVTMPLGLQWKDGVLYTTAWSVAGQFGITPAGAPPVGVVAKVRRSAFTPL